MLFQPRLRCHHDPCLPAGSVIINNCAGCDRRFRKLYEGISTITYWEVLDFLPGVSLPDYGGVSMSVHDSCSFRCKPQVHGAIRSLLRKMNVTVAESEFSREKSICCGDVVVTCISCIRSMTVGGKRARYLPDVIFGRDTLPMTDGLTDYHDRLEAYIAAH